MSENPLEFGMVCVVVKLTLCYVFQRVLFFLSCTKIKEKNPDWIFVIDRTAALGEPGPAALTVLDNPLVHQTTAWRKGQIVLMPTANYIVAGGAQQLQQAAAQLRDAFNAHPAHQEQP